jgi:anti-sigma regulatory factor (Ser/Thr protein kinase)
MASSTSAYRDNCSCIPPDVLRLVISRGGRGAVHKLGRSSEPWHQVLAWLGGQEAAPAVGIVRAQVLEFLAASKVAVSRGLIDDVVLCMSEVVTNALVHTKSRAIAIRVATLADTGRGVGVAASVSDEDATMLAHRPTGPDCTMATTGRGLTLLAALSHWGSTPWHDGRGKDVWFICPPPPVPPRRA